MNPARSHSCKSFSIVVQWSQHGVTWCKAVIVGKPQLHFLTLRTKVQAHALPHEALHSEIQSSAKAE